MHLHIAEDMTARQTHGFGEFIQADAAFCLVALQGGSVDGPKLVSPWEEGHSGRLFLSPR
jgi:hypothetical protein